MTVIDKKFVAPALPGAPPEYDSRRDDQLNYSLRLYFNLLDNYLAQLTALLNNGGPFDSLTADEFIGGTFDGGAVNATYGRFNNFNGAAGTFDALLTKSVVGTNIMGENFYGGRFYGDGRYINTPYNQFESHVSQTATNVADANFIELEVTDFADGITITGANDTRITFTEAGIYFITYSLQFSNTSNDQQSIDIWIRYNGTDYANSNSRFFIPTRKSAGVPSHLIAVTTIAGDAINDNDYVEIMWRPSDIAVSLEYLPAVTASPGVTPDIPATPSAIVQASFVSAQFPLPQRIAPAPVFGFGEIGNVIVSTN